MKSILVNNLAFSSRLDTDLSPSPSTLRVNTPPLGLLTLATILTTKGHDVTIVDFGDLARAGAIPTGADFYPEAARHIVEAQPDWVGFSSRCDSYHCMLRIAKEVKSLSPHTPTVFGGPQATVTDMESLTLFPFVDFITCNEAEETLPELLEALGGTGDFASILGLTWRKGDKVERNAKRPLIRDLNAYPISNYDFYTRDFEGRWPIEVGRGCPFGCTFCSTNVYFDRSYRLKSGPRLVEEIRYLMDNFGAREFHFVHDMFTVDKKRVLQICKDLVEARLDVAWDCSARLDCINDEVLTAMRQAGCDAIYMGIETGSQSIQKIVKKNLKLDILEPKIRTLNEMGYGVTTSFIAGFEDETLDDVSDTLDSIVKCVLLDVSLVQLHLCAPLRGAASYTMNKGSFEYDGYLSDQVDPIFFSEEDQDLIKSSEEVFSAFYYVRPKHVPREFYHGLDFFGYASLNFRHTLYYILKTSPLTPLDLFTGLKDWLAKSKGISLTVSGSFGMTEFYPLCAEYIRHLIESDVLTYPYLRDILEFNVALTYFRRTAGSQPDNAGEGIVLELPESAVPTLGPNVVVQSYNSDISRLIQILNEGLEPEISPTISQRTHIVLRSRISGVEIIKISAFFKAILSLCDGSRNLRDIRAVLRNRLAKNWEDEKAEELISKAVAQLAQGGIISVQSVSPGGVIPDRESRSSAMRAGD
ncbi:MAG TPA: radical SAM protein [Blastocatellia bacterium]|nr:radical SAM protein [Blastocatellia bacterium]